MHLKPYKKPYKTASELCEMMREKGLTINEPDKACKVLERSSYYRFKAYLAPLTKDKKYITGSSFEQAQELYEFDEELRSFLFKKIQHIEVGVRSAFDQWMTDRTKTPFWYLDPKLFDNADSHIKVVRKVRDMFVGSQELFAKHYIKNYYNDFCPFYRQLPPGWVAIEVMSFGNLSNLMSATSKEQEKTLKLNRFANKKLDVSNFQTLANWVTVIHEVRNHCGHHNRLFNRNVKAPTAIGKLLKKYNDGNIGLIRRKNERGKMISVENRLFSVLCILQVILLSLGYDKIGTEFKSLLDKYPEVSNHMEAMGFPENWFNLELLF